jgi:hypothetical protein
MKALGEMSGRSEGVWPNVPENQWEKSVGAGKLGPKATGNLTELTPRKRNCYDEGGCGEIAHIIDIKRLLLQLLLCHRNSRLEATEGRQLAFEKPK